MFPTSSDMKKEQLQIRTSNQHSSSISNKNTNHNSLDHLLGLYNEFFSKTTIISPAILSAELRQRYCGNYGNHGN
jgi:hypothetical protein